MYQMEEENSGRFFIRLIKECYNYPGKPALACMLLISIIIR